MFDVANIKRYCIINPEAGNISIKLMVEKDLVCGSEFRIYDENSKELPERIKLGAQDNDYIIKQIKTNLKELNRKVLVWQLLICSKKVEIDTGRVSIELQQQGKSCKLTIPAIFKIDNIPPCKIKRSRKLTQSLMFIHKI